MPVIDRNRRQMGLISQSDLIAALYGSGINQVLALSEAAPDL